MYEVMRKTIYSLINLLYCIAYCLNASHLVKLITLNKNVDSTNYEI